MSALLKVAGRCSGSAWKVESAERAEDYQMGMRVFVGQRSATISSGQLDDKNITQLAERAVAMARHAPENPYARLAQQRSRQSLSRN